LALLVGAAIGIGTYTFAYAKGYSYLANDPAACATWWIPKQGGVSVWRACPDLSSADPLEGAMHVQDVMTERVLRISPATAADDAGT
jgi:hypothetical protein